MVRLDWVAGCSRAVLAIPAGRQVALPLPAPPRNIGASMSSSIHFTHGMQFPMATVVIAVQAFLERLSMSGRARSSISTGTLWRRRLGNYATRLALSISLLGL